MPTCMHVRMHLGAVLLTVGRSYVGNDFTHSTLLDRACACSYKNLPKYRSYRVSSTAPSTLTPACRLYAAHAYTFASDKLSLCQNCQYIHYTVMSYTQDPSHCKCVCTIACVCMSVRNNFVCAVILIMIVGIHIMCACIRV